MYAIISDGGKNYKVAPGKTVDIEKRDIAKGKPIVFDKVLYYRDKDGVQVGTPLVDGLKVQGVVEDNFKGEKVTVFKFKRRKGYRRKQGHRQNYTRVLVNSISKD